jgi:hypothetical protein
MLLGKEPEFVRRFGSLWNIITPISDTETLKKHFADTTLVALDIEGHVNNINEIGVSISLAQQLKAPGDGSLTTFYHQNALCAHTIMIEEMRSKKRHEATKFGDSMTVPRREVCGTLSQILSGVEQPEHQLILVGYDMYTEFDWISQNCPLILSRFHHWVDVQELAEQSCGLRPSLLKVLKAMNIRDRGAKSSTPHGHRAANDAVRTMAVLSTLVSRGHFEYHPLQETRLLSCAPQNWKGYPFKARISTNVNDMLPSCIKTPKALSAYFESYNPIAVLINSKAALSKGVRVWWICFSSKDSLEKVVADLNGIVLDGKKLVVESCIAHWVLQHLTSDSSATIITAKEIGTE